jgi:hypothetical protein
MMLAALVARPTPARRFASVPLMLACMLLPCVAPLSAFLRMILACMGLLAMLKTLQLDYEPRWAATIGLAWPVALRCQHRTGRFAGLRRAPVRAGAAARGLLALRGRAAASARRRLLARGAAAAAGRCARVCAMETATEGLRFAHRLFGSTCRRCSACRRLRAASANSGASAGTGR